MQRVRPPSKSSENMERGASFDFVTFKGRLILISTFLGRAFFSRRLFKWDLFSFSLPIKYIPKLKFRKRFSESNSNLKVKVQSQSQSPLPKSKSDSKVKSRSQSQRPEKQNIDIAFPRHDDAINRSCWLCCVLLLTLLNQHCFFS